MTLLVLGHPYAYEMENVLRMFYPGGKITVIKEGEPETVGTVAALMQTNTDGTRLLTASVGAESRAVCLLEAGASSDEAEWALARLLFGLLCEKTGRRPKWGVLTGVRPVRLFRSALEQCGGDEASALRLMSERWLVSEEKALLAADIARRQRPLLERELSDSFSLYVSIPFCPSRCLYCSFISHDIAGAKKLAPEYVRLLRTELVRTGELAARLGLRARTVYIGGGTPTSLEAEQLADVMEAVRSSFDLSELAEYTVEAGRPDTITAEKLAVMRRLGANRVSVNPQTMDGDILRTIGRGHNPESVERSFALARDADFDNINMDLIADLPGEDGSQLAHTLDRVLAMAPESVTVHTLTVKRSSRLRETDNAFDGPRTDALTSAAHERLERSGYRPYYLYRQKGSAAGLENTGYALPGREGLYNVLIMEEAQTILAAGAGAATKLILPDGTISRIFNHKYPHEYTARFDEILARKDEAEALLDRALRRLL